MEQMIAWLVETIGRMGYPGIIALMFLESSFIPFPSEVVIPPAGYLASRGEMNIYLVVLSGVVGSLLGAFFNYYIALFLGRPLLLKYGRYLFLPPSGLKRSTVSSRYTERSAPSYAGSCRASGSTSRFPRGSPG